MPDPDEPQIRPFADVIRDHQQGRTHDELSEKLHALVAAVTDTGKKGSLVLTLKVEPMKGDETVLLVSDDINAKIPRPDRKPSIFYTDDAGNLSRTNPDQPQFEFLREVADTDKPTELKEAN